jgi:hypothetical protein
MQRVSWLLYETHMTLPLCKLIPYDQILDFKKFCFEIFFNTCRPKSFESIIKLYSLTIFNLHLWLKLYS